MKIGIIATVLFMLAVNAVANDDLLWEGTPQHHMRSDGTIETWKDYGNYGIRSDSNGNSEMIFKQDIYPAFPVPQNRPEPYKPSFGKDRTDTYNKPIYKPIRPNTRVRQGSWYDLSD
ncbi:MAG: hypothetical protein KBI48_04815 [Deltaproteobacteria bacterium]|nr:hypothetical protein [Deltaproteobacteria bacterium]MDI9559280.1 hypothetical protein [Pseudomonadota bacterium]